MAQSEPDLELELRGLRDEVMNLVESFNALRLRGGDRFACRAMAGSLGDAVMELDAHMDWGEP